MNFYHILFSILGLFVLSSIGYADNAKKESAHQNRNEKSAIKVKQIPKEKSSKLQQLTYLPPFLGAPSDKRLVGMALRGGTSDLLLSVLTPAHTGLSVKAQPDIYWYTSKPISKHFQFVEFVLVSDQAIKPLLRTHLTPANKDGIQQISLSDYNITLEPNVEYTWAISLVPDPSTRSYDLVTSGSIMHIAAAHQLEKEINTTKVDQHAYIFAQAGFWYDTLSVLVKQANNSSNRLIAKEALLSLLKSVELVQIADKMATKGKNSG